MIITLIITVLKWAFCTQDLWSQFLTSDNLNQYLDKRKFQMREAFYPYFTKCMLVYIKLYLICKLEYLDK